MYVTRSSDAVTFSFDPSARIRLREIPRADGSLDLSSRVTVAVGSNPSFEKVVAPLLPYVMPLLAGMDLPSLLRHGPLEVVAPETKQVLWPPHDAAA